MTTYTKGWFLIYIKSSKYKIPVAIRYEDSNTFWESYTMTSACSMNGENIIHKFTFYFPTFILRKFCKDKINYIKPLGKSYIDMSSYRLIKKEN